MADRFWRQAERDLAVARELRKPDSGFAAANYAHQAAEKALKACLWHLTGAEPPWRHDVGLLAERVGDASGGGIPRQVDLAIDYLDPLFAETRYPSGDTREPIPADAISLEQAQEAVTSAVEVLEWVRGLLRFLKP